MDSRVGVYGRILQKHYTSIHPIIIENYARSSAEIQDNTHKLEIKKVLNTLKHLYTIHRL